MGDRRTLEDGDVGFRGVNEVDPPALLAPGEVSFARNKRFTRGEAEPRLGVAKLAWANRTGLQPFETIWGTYDFRDAQGGKWLIVAADGKVYRTREANGMVEVQLPPGVAIEYEVSFEQTQQGLVMFRGDDLDQLIMANLDAGFVPIAQVANTVTGALSENSVLDPADPTGQTRLASDGTQTIPRAERGKWVNNRLFILYKTATEKDLLAESDYLNATRYASVRASGRINQGSSDAAVTFEKFDERAGVVFKEKSIYALYNLQGNLTEQVLDEITREFGIAGPRAVAQVGRGAGDQAPPMLWFLADRRGVCAVVVGESGKLEVTAVPVSRKLEQTIARIDWRYANKACAASWNNKFYLAVPLDEGKAVRARNEVEGATYSGAGTYQVDIVPGATYLWTKGANDTSIDTGVTVATDTREISDGATFTYLLNGVPNAPVTAQLQRVYSGVNNAILVYDFVRGEWAGYDAGSAIMPKEFRTMPSLGVERLWFAGEDGWMNMVEELYYDEASNETLGGNIVGGTYPAGLTLEFATTPGGLYAYNLLDREYSLTNGTEVIVSDGATVRGTLVAQGDRVRLQGIAGAATFAPTANIKPITSTIAPEWIEDEVLTRGWNCGRNVRKRFFEGVAGLRTWYPSFAISAVVEGVSEEIPVLPRAASVADQGAVTKDPTAYYQPFNKADWNPTNVNDDHAEAHREDYSVVIGETTTPSGSIQAGLLYYVEAADVTSACSITYNGTVYNNQSTFTGVPGVTTYVVSSGSPRVYGPGNYVYAGAGGLGTDVEQEIEEPLKFPATVRGRWMQLRVRNTQGRCTLTHAAVEAELVDRGRRTRD
jgi:hypothetical protein